MRRARPFLLAAADRAQAGDPVEGDRPLPPLPAAPEREGVVAALQYLSPLARALLAYRREEQRVRRAAVEDQRALDALLGELGRTAREEARRSAPPGLAALASEMRALDTTEDRRDRAGSEARAAITRRAEEAERLAASESELRVAAARQRHAVRELRRGTPERAAAERELAAAEARLAAAVEENRRALRASDEELRRWQSEGRDAASEQVRRQVHVGTLLNLNRVPHPRLDPLYAGIDALRRRLDERDGELARLAEARERYDHAAVHTALFAIAAFAGALILGALALVLIFR